MPCQQPIIHTCTLKTPLGTMIAGATTQGLCLLEFDITERLQQHEQALKKQFTTTAPPRACPGTESQSLRQHTHLNQLKKQLSEYFSGQRRTFTVPLDISGTPFQEQVWRSLLTIAYGTTISYQAEARAIGKPNAVRAVAGANNTNRIAIVIPCHRVIGKDGSMRGYGGEIWRKEYLIQLENRINSDETA